MAAYSMNRPAGLRRRSRRAAASQSTPKISPAGCWPPRHAVRAGPLRVRLAQWQLGLCRRWVCHNGAACWMAAGVVLAPTRASETRRYYQDGLHRLAAPIRHMPLAGIAARSCRVVAVVRSVSAACRPAPSIAALVAGVFRWFARAQRRLRPGRALSAWSPGVWRRALNSPVAGRPPQLKGDPALRRHRHRCCTKEYPALLLGVLPQALRILP